jgi:UDP-N-acetylmuramoyl-L-alanyl-D-glutamate--2,6-diaminopimelate ligase
MMALRRISHAWRLSDLLDGFASVPPQADVTIGGIDLDSRRIDAGGLFLACSGAETHGLDFAAGACARGTAAIVAEPCTRWDLRAMSELGGRLGVPVVPVPDLGQKASALADRFFGQPSTAMEIIGVTGTNGKTSVTHYLAQALGVELKCGVIGTLGVGFPGELAESAHTTPDPVTLQETLAMLRGGGARAVAMEVSSHALAQGRAAGVRFSCAVFTNLSRDHLDYHGDMESYGIAKRQLFRMPGLRWAVLNLDDPLSAEIAEELEPSAKVAYYTVRSDAHRPPKCDLWVRASEVTPGPGGLYLRLATSAGMGELRVNLLGRFNASNLLAVLSVMLSRGLPLERALREISRVRTVPGRMERFGGDGAPLVVVDYAHTPDALEQALVNLREHASGRIHCVIGCGGNRDRGKRPLMGAIAEGQSDRVIVTDDNPRSEDGNAIVEEILAGMERPNAVTVERHRSLAIRLAIATASERDLVLIAGKGHETTQDMGELKVHFSDGAQVLQVLQERGGLNA